MRRRLIFATTLLLLAASPAAMAAATAEEAAQIKAAFEAYVGAEPGLVDVQPSGDDYAIKLDPMVYVNKWAQAPFTAKFDPVTMTVRPLGDGKWDVKQTGPYNFSWNAEGISSFDAKIANFDWSGVYDPSLFAFVNSKQAATGITVSQSMTDPSTKVKTESATSIESWTGESTSAAGNGGVDSNGTMGFKGITVASKSQMPPEMAQQGMPSFDYNATVADGAYTSKITGFKAKEIMEVVAWLIAHPSKEVIVRDQAQLKEKLQAALPLWQELDSSGGYGKTDVGTMLGNFSLDSLTGGATIQGLTKTGLFREAVGFKGLVIPPGIAPPWSDGLVPKDFNLDFSVTGFDAETPANLILANLDLSKEPPVPESLNGQLIGALAPTMSVNVALANGLIAASDYAITYDGSMAVSFMGFPTGKVNIRMTGMDAVVAKVQAAASSDPMAQQAMGMLVAAKGFGKAEADGSMLWVVETAAPNKLMINGVDMSSFMGAPPAQ